MRRPVLLIFTKNTCNILSALEGNRITTLTITHINIWNVDNKILHVFFVKVEGAYKDQK
jgi:hypothetical protein